MRPLSKTRATCQVIQPKSCCLKKSSNLLYGLVVTVKSVFTNTVFANHGFLRTCSGLPQNTATARPVTFTVEMANGFEPAQKILDKTVNKSKPEYNAKQIVSALQAPTPSFLDIAMEVGVSWE